LQANVNPVSRLEVPTFLVMGEDPGNPRTELQDFHSVANLEQEAI